MYKDGHQPFGDIRHSAKFARVDYLLEKGYIEYMEVNGRITKGWDLEHGIDVIGLLGEVF